MKKIEMTSKQMWQELSDILDIPFKTKEQRQQEYKDSVVRGSKLSEFEYMDIVGQEEAKELEQTFHDAFQVIQKMEEEYSVARKARLGRLLSSGKLYFPKTMH